MVGLVCILAGWIPETLETIKNRRCALNSNFALLYFLGSGSLAVYSFLTNDYIFIVLNAASTLMALINLYFCHFGTGKKSK